MLSCEEPPAAIPVPQSLTGWLLQNHRPLMQQCDEHFVRGPALFDVPAAGWMLPLQAVAPLVGVIASQLLPPSVSRSVEIRRKGFIAGRLCAERCLAELGIPGKGVGRLHSGAPSWPHGVVGSITHSSCHAFAVAFGVSSVRVMGVDSEPLIQAEDVEAIGDLCCTTLRGRFSVDEAGHRHTAVMRMAIGELRINAVRRGK